LLALELIGPICKFEIKCSVVNTVPGLTVLLTFLNAFYIKVYLIKLSRKKYLLDLFLEGWNL